MEIPETKRFIPKGFELGTTFSQPNRSIGEKLNSTMLQETWTQLFDMLISCELFFCLTYLKIRVKMRKFDKINVII